MAGSASPFHRGQGPGKGVRVSLLPCAAERLGGVGWNSGTRMAALHERPSLGPLVATRAVHQVVQRWI